MIERLTALAMEAYDRVHERPSAATLAAWDEFARSAHRSRERDRDAFEQNLRERFAQFAQEQCFALDHAAEVAADIEKSAAYKRIDALLKPAAQAVRDLAFVDHPGLKSLNLLRDAVEEEARLRIGGSKGRQSRAEPSVFDVHGKQLAVGDRVLHQWRPVEPGTFPLAHGVPGRVGLLRGYGNAIVPQVAALFIRSVMDLLL